MKIVVRSMSLPKDSQAWSGMEDSQKIREVEIRGFKRLLSFYGRDINDSNFKDHKVYVSYLADEHSRTMVRVPYIILIEGQDVEAGWNFIGTAVLDEGRQVYHLFQPRFAQTGLMKS